MNDDERLFEVISIGDLRRRRAESGEKPPVIKLDPAKVPASLHGLIPLAERWGISDDTFRMDARDDASPEEFRSVQSTVATFNHEFDAWLAGPEAYSPPSAEYVAFSCLRMFTDGC